ncbi:phosphoenolpyruvate--protein phosphotransferase [Actinoplanes friuliensis]|uniref:Phosphocarrier protein HPr n=1 Tax=Actinoplanes friuliensis DSM 7358 TaxID=1246995 RepID=U5VXI7_9ACTN|nr:phosphoenolpyruvate--protein phosphotransferase [Actinoplanes friuliensis]AGZ41559.1 multiphosphoryl transfer protein (MTP) [Actinoplanes friuliensis DSM 7358]
MVGLVVVSHSRALALAAVALATEMVHGPPVPIEIAAGLDKTTFGTDAVAIMTAVTTADQGDGVVVLMDLGSAVLSAELALELLDDDTRARVILCPAPFVEGLVAAAVTAASGADRHEVAGEAAGGSAGKESQLGAPTPDPSPGTLTAPSTTFTVTDPHGLHARPAARLVAEARAHDARVELRNSSTGSAWVPASSLSRVATLGALPGHTIEVRASGPQAEQATAAIVALASEKAPAAGAETAGRAASPGIGIGPARHLRVPDPELPDVASQGPEAELGRIEEALATVRRDLRKIRATGEAAAIFDAHLLLLDDTVLLDDVRARLAGGLAAPQAWSAATGRIAAEFAALADPYLKGRAADVRAVADQVLRALLGLPEATVPESGVIIAPDLTPAQASGLDPARVAAVVLASGSRTSHAAILARTRGIPAVVAQGPGVLDIGEGTTVAVDGSTGEVEVAPSEAVLAAYRDRAVELEARRARAGARASTPAVTREGVAVTVAANVGSAADARAAAAAGADEAGLVRTEFLFLDRDTAPTAAEQLTAYREIADALGGRRLTLRTLDVGGDKPLRYAPAAAEDNPFLGVRGLRHSLAHPALFEEQLLAIVRVAHEVPVSIMFPMVAVVPELVRARQLLDEVIRRDGGGRPSGLRVGIMVEIPAAALKTAAFAPHVDFVSIGTNDLTQYALAAERGNAALAGLADGLDPGVLRLIDAVCRGAGTRVTVAVCGELAGDEAAVPLLTGLGVRELSVAPPAVPAIKEAVRATTLDRAALDSARALDLPDAAAVRALLT